MGLYRADNINVSNDIKINVTEPDIYGPLEQPVCIDIPACELGTFYINGEQVSETEWASLADSLKGGFPSASRFLEDGNFSGDEIKSLFYADKDGYVSLDDLGNVSENEYFTFKGILSRHGVDIALMLSESIHLNGLSNERAKNLKELVDKKRTNIDSDVDHPSCLWSDRAFVMSMVQKNGNYLRFVKGPLQGDRDIELAAVNQNAGAIKYAKSINSEKGIMMGLVARNGLLLEFAGEQLKNDRDVVLTAVSQNGLALQFVSPFLASDEEICRMAILQDEGAYQFAGPELKEDKEIALNVVSKNGEMLHYVSESLRNDPDVALAAIGNDYAAYGYVGDGLRSSPSFLLDAVSANLFLIESEYALGYEGELWKGILERYDNFNSLNIPAEHLASYVAFKNYVRMTYDLENIERFRSVDGLIDVLKIRSGVKGFDDRPLAVLFSAKYDDTGALGTNGTNVYPILQDLQIKGFRVAYYEVDEQDEISRGLSEATSGGENRASVIFIDAHGATNGMILGDFARNVAFTEIDKKWISVYDMGSNDRYDFASFIATDGNVILGGCSNGSGGALKANNFANSLARYLPRGVTLHAAKDSVVSGAILMLDDGNLYMDWGDDLEYIVEGGDTGAIKTYITKNTDFGRSNDS